MSSNRILVADRANGSGLSHQLNELGYTALLAEGPEELEQALDTEYFNMLCIGLDIPGVDYQAVFDRMARDMALIYVPILVFGTAANRDVFGECIQMGAHDYLELPASLTLIKARMESCLGSRMSPSNDALDIKSALELANDLQHIILPMGIELTEKREFDSLQSMIVSKAQDLCNADGATLYLVREDDTLAFVAIHTRSLKINMGGDSGVPITFPPLPLYDAESGEPNHHNIATHVALTGQRAHIPDVYTTDKFDFSATRVFDKRNNYRTVSCLALPLKNNEGKVIGVLQIINPQDTRTGQITPFKINDQLAAEALATQAAIAINNHILLIKEQALIKFETDVQVGRSVQASFLPKSLPSLEGWDIAAQFHPAREVAGDFYDVMDLNRNTLGLVIADVCDKGVPAALYMALTRSLLRALSQRKYALSWADGLFDEDKNTTKNWRAQGLDMNIAPLKEGLTHTNEYLVEYHSDLMMFATMFFGLLNTQTGALSYVNCGHNPPVVIDKNCKIVNVLKPGAPAIGIMPNLPFKIDHVQLNPGDTLMTFTDGVPESRAPDGAFYTDERLNEFLTAGPILSVKNLLSDLVVDLRTHIADAVQFDDITMLAVRREE